MENSELTSLASAQTYRTPKWIRIGVDIRIDENEWIAARNSIDLFRRLKRSNNCKQQIEKENSNKATQLLGPIAAQK